MIIIGLVLLIAAIVVGAAAVSANLGTAHAVSNGFSVFGHYFSSSAGILFIGGIVVGAVGMLGLSLILSGYWRSTRDHAATRRELRKTRRQAGAAPSAKPKPAPSS
ncbi:hypothetical protein [Nocardia alni]|uniref:hypothetical protein n=1 Tax=Nocardia alni TaxID=2815723 RepID=UPI001C25111D|nr:hypothetical protein [Nocardia alni]